MSEDKSVQVLVRTTAVQAEAVDDWRRRQADIPSRPEAMRRLSESALAMSTIADDIEDFRNLFKPPLTPAEALRYALKQAKALHTATPMLKDRLGPNGEVLVRTAGLDLDSEPERG